MANFKKNFGKKIVEADIGDGMLNEASKSAIKKSTFLYLDSDQILINKRNKYSIENIQELASAIAATGLLQPLIIMESEEYPDSNKYDLLAGERRFTALKYLGDNVDPEYHHNIETKIVDPDDVKLPLDREHKILYLITITNSESRDYTNQDIMTEYENLKSIYNMAKKNGWKLSEEQKLLLAAHFNIDDISKIRTRHLISKELGFSPAQEAKLSIISKNATPEIKEKLNTGEITVATAKDISTLDQESQKEISSLPGKDITPDVVKRYKELQEQSKNKAMDAEHKESNSPLTSPETQEEEQEEEQEELYTINLNEYPFINKTDELELKKADYIKFKSSVSKIQKELQKVSSIIGE